MTDRWTITCGVCGLIGPARAACTMPLCPRVTASAIPPASWCWSMRCAGLLQPERFDHQGKIIPGQIAHVLRTTHMALVLSAAALRADPAAAAKAREARNGD